MLALGEPGVVAVTAGIRDRYMGSEAWLQIGASPPLPSYCCTCEMDGRAGSVASFCRSPTESYTLVKARAKEEELSKLVLP